MSITIRAEVPKNRHQVASTYVCNSGEAAVWQLLKCSGSVANTIAKHMHPRLKFHAGLPLPTVAGSTAIRRAVVVPTLLK